MPIQTRLIIGKGKKLLNPETSFDAIYIHNIDSLFQYDLTTNIYRSKRSVIKNSAYLKSRILLHKCNDLAQKINIWLNKKDFDVNKILSKTKIIIFNEKLKKRISFLQKHLPDHKFISIEELNISSSDSRKKHIFIAWDDSPLIFKGQFEPKENILALERFHDQIVKLVCHGFSEFTFGLTHNKIKTKDNIYNFRRYSFGQRPLQGNLKSNIKKQIKLLNEGQHVTIKSTLFDFIDKHDGETAVILGNGPSLNDVPVKLFNGKTVFGSNQVYLADEKIKQQIDYWFISDRLQMERYADDFAFKLKDWGVRKFVPSSYANILKFDSNTTSVFSHSFENPDGLFSFDENIIYTGKTVIFVMCQAAAIMGFKKIIIVGMDHNYSLKQVVGKKTVGGGSSKIEFFSQNEAYSQTHFSKEYSSNRIFHMPNYDAIADRMRSATVNLNEHGIEIVNATPNTKLTTVPRVKTEDLINPSD